MLPVEEVIMVLPMGKVDGVIELISFLVPN